MSDFEDLPVPMDTIEVRFSVNGKLKWWPTKVDNITDYKDKSKSLGRGTIMYEAMDGYPVTHANVLFLPGNRLMHHNKKETETTWRFDDPQIEKSDEDYDACAVGRPAKKNCPAPVPEHPCSDDRLTALEKSLDKVWRRIASLERQSTHMGKCDHRELVSDRVGSIRVVLRRMLLDKVLGSTRTWKKTNTPYGEILRSTTESIEVHSDLKMVQYIASDIFDSIDADISHFAPRYSQVMLSIRHASVDIVFRHAAAFMDWLGLDSKADREELFCQRFTERQSPNIRVMGSVQVTEGYEDDPLMIFVGHTSSSEERYRSHDGCNTDIDVDVPANRAITGWNAESLKTPVVKCKTSEWDSENGMFMHTPEITSENPGRLSSAAANEAFTVSWKRFDTTVTRRYTAETLDPSDVVPGVIVLNYPMIYARGDTMVSSISSAVNQVRGID